MPTTEEVIFIFSCAQLAVLPFKIKRLLIPCAALTSTDSWSIRDFIDHLPQEKLLCSYLVRAPHGLSCFVTLCCF